MKEDKTFKENYDRIQELDKKRTQGKWHIGHINEQCDVLMDVDSGEGEIAEDVYEDNAKFIAAAPQMAEMLREMYEANANPPYLVKADGTLQRQDLVELEAKIEKYEKALRAIIVTGDKVSMIKTAQQALTEKDIT
jgi:hypothetical protein